MQLPSNHPLRQGLNDEVHARPPEALRAPCRITYLAVVPPANERQAEWQHVCRLCQERGVQPPGEQTNHFTADLGDFRLKWERHTEFSRYKLIADGSGRAPFAGPPAGASAADWLARLVGETLVAAQIALIPESTLALETEALSERYFDGNPVIGSTLSGGAARGFTDFRIREDGFSRVLVLDRSLAPRQAGRVIQRLVEVDTYRMMALLALPVARSLGPFLSQHERELAEITAVMTEGGVAEEQGLHDRLTRLEAAIEKRFVDTNYRFNASAAYYDLVQRRIEELREERIVGLQTFREFTERRLAPAMSTCRATATRIEALSNRVSRSSQLLSTRVAIAREQQNQGLLEVLAHRAQLQLRLQQTVEGLSIAAISYYIVGLIGYVAKGSKVVLHDIEPDLVMAISIPLVIMAVAYGLHSVRKGLAIGKDA
jgi:uncharacterized membrane-anchored protein